MPSENQSYREALRRSAALRREIEANPSDFRILSGDRPTGTLHVGHYFGTLQNRVELQELGVGLFVLIADYQVLTDRDLTAGIAGNVLDLLLDYLAIGIDPQKADIFAHSYVPELNQLMLPFLSLVSIAELDRNPTIKAEIRMSDRPTVSSLMFTYPLHQAADILFCHGNLVPVGRDQLPHIELARAIARRFNERYSAEAPYFEEPEGLLSDAPLLLGTDGQKMSKSLRNTISISSSEDETAALLRAAKTDSDRTVTYDPENRPEVSNLVLLAALCQGKKPEEVAASIGDRGAAELKKVTTESVNEYFRPIRARRTELAKDPGYVKDVLRSGNECAREIAERTLARVRNLMAMEYYTP